jgi:FkbH-like protein
MTLQSTLDHLLQRVEAQPLLFAPKLSRLALQGLALAAPPRQNMRINVWRNHAVENVLNLAAPYFSFAGIGMQTHVGHYDDSLSFADHQPADIELLWLDSERYLSASSVADWAGWLSERLAALRTVSGAPIVLATWAPAESDGAAVLQAAADACPGAYFADLAALCAEAAINLTDKRTAAMAGTPLANAAQLLIARKLACHWLPGAALPPIKAVVLDLDHTLHAGVLGEEGIHGVTIADGYDHLQQAVAKLRERGVFLALASRNERADVEALFAERADYPLRWENFSVTEVSWDAKAEAIRRIAAALRIAPDAMLFVDDNPGELASVQAELPGLHTVHAGADPRLTELAIAWYPGLWRWRVEADDAKRVQDLQANAQRAALLSGANDAGSYFRSLQVQLDFYIDPAPQLSRAADLCKKTNQFNLALRRFNEAEVAQHMAAPLSCVATVHMRDRLADSGSIAVLVAERSGAMLRVEELCISCRAMGRQLEDTVVLGALAAMPLLEGCDEVAFVVRHGPRNQPALDWLGKLLGLSAQPAEGEHRLPAATVRAFTPDANLTLTYDKTRL